MLADYPADGINWSVELRYHHPI